MLLPKQKKNIIENGWDSFEPYGFGASIGKAPVEVFNEDYAQNEIKNGDFRVNELNNFFAPNSYGIPNVVNNTLEIEVSEDKPGLPVFVRSLKRFTMNDVYYIKVRVKPFKTHDFLMYDGRGSFSPGKVEAGKFNEVSIVWKYGSGNGLNLYANGEDMDNSFKGDKTIIDYVYVANLTERFGEGNEPDKEWCDSNLKYQPNWEDLPEEEKPVDVYEHGMIYTESLGNGKQRIRTVGGQEVIKFRFEKNFENKDLTFSTYLENNSDEPMGIKVLDNEEKTYAPNFKGMVEEYGKG